MSRIIALVLLVSAGVSDAQEWNYTDTSAWSVDFPACGFSFQSPIDLNDSTVVLKNYPPLWFSEVYFDDVDGTLLNNGHGLRFDPDTLDPELTVRGGPLGNDTYQFLQLHFHWGEDNKQGSEHTRNGRRFPLEVHLVHFNQKYGNVGTALGNSDGLLVITFWFRLDRRALTPKSTFSVQTHGPDVLVAGDTTPITVNLGQYLLEESDTSSYYTYEGSLTTPPCSEAVRFIIFKRPLTLGRPPVLLNNVFRFVEDDFGVLLLNNFRPPQPLNGRTVFCSV